jgi:hypothetical protein
MTPPHDAEGVVGRLEWDVTGLLGPVIALSAVTA